MNLIAEMAQIRTFFRSYIYHISYLAKEYTKNHDDGERNFGCSQG